MMRIHLITKTFFLTLLLLQHFFPAFSQPGNNANGIITARLLDSLTHQPVPFALVVVFKNDNEKPVAQTLSSDSGQFRVSKLSPGVYKIRITLLGYKTFAKDSIVIQDENSNLNLGDLVFSADARMLQGATVVATQDIIDNQPDKLVYHADKDVTTAGGTVIDLLKKIPGVSVDINGNIELLGASGVRFLVNGKPSTLLGSNPVDVLQAIPADQVKSIEVITSPSAKYDAQGTGGIINIIMKKTTLQGLTGDVSLGAGTRIDKGNGMISYRHEDFGISANVGGNYYVPQNGTNDFLRTTKANDTISTLSQNAITHSGRNNFYPAIDMDWDISDNDNISASAAWDDFRNSGNSTTNILSSTQNLNDDQSQVKHSYNSTHETSLELSADYSHDFDTTGKQLDFSFEYSGDHDSTDFSLDQSLVSSAIPANPNDFLVNQKGSNLGKENESIFSLDITLPYKNDFTFSTGAKASLYDVNSNYTVRNYDTVSNDYVTDFAQSNTFISKQQVGALYSTFSFKPWEKFSVNAGMRYEQTYSNNHLVNSTTDYKQAYGTFVPSLAIYKKFKMQTVKLNYTRRIERPEYDEMNPFMNTSDRFNIFAGNPYLLPENQHRIEFSYSRSAKSGITFTSTLYYRHQTNDIQNYTTYYPVYILGNDTFNNVSVSIRQNIVTKNSFGLNIFGAGTVWKKLTVRGNFNMSQDYLQNTRDPSAAIVKVFRYNINMNISLELPWQTVAEAFGVFNSPRYTLQGYRPSYTEYSIGVKKLFNKKKGSIGLNAMNFYTKNIVFATSTTGSNFMQKSTATIPYRSFGITFSYFFGNVKDGKDENENNGNPLFQK